jgi:hypothetical protein
VDLTNQRAYFTWYGPAFGTANASSPATYNMRESVTEGSGVAVSAYFSTESSVEVSISAHKKSIFQPELSVDHGVGFEIVGVHKPSAVVIEAWKNSLCSHVYVDAVKTLTVTCVHNEGGVKIHIEGVQSSLF